MATHSHPGSSTPSEPTEKIGSTGKRDVPRTHVKTESPRSARKSEEEESFMASDLFCHVMGTMINKQDVHSILEKQAETLTKFEKTTAKFGRFNDLSASRYLHLNQQLKNHTKMLLDMKKDLDSIFRRIRTLKTKLTKQYGLAFNATSAGIQKLEEELGASVENEDTASLSTLTESKEFNSDSQSTNQGIKNAEQEVKQKKTGEVVRQGSDLSVENRTAQTTEMKMQDSDDGSLTSVSSVHSTSRTVETEDISMAVSVVNLERTVDINKINISEDNSQTSQIVDIRQVGDVTGTVDNGDTSGTVDTCGITEAVDISDKSLAEDSGCTTQAVVTGDITHTAHTSNLKQTIDIGEDCLEQSSAEENRTGAMTVGVENTSLSQI